MRFAVEYDAVSGNRTGPESRAGLIASLAGQSNRAVDVRPKGRSDWLLGEEGRLSAFLLGMTAWQVALMLPEKARCALRQNELQKLLEFFEPVGAPNVRVGSSQR